MHRTNHVREARHLFMLYSFFFLFVIANGKNFVKLRINIVSVWNLL